MLNNLFTKTIESIDSIRESVEPRFQISRNERGWFVRYLEGKSINGNDWVKLNEEGSFRDDYYRFDFKFKVGYYSTEEEAQNAMNMFVIRKCLQRYEQDLRRHYECYYKPRYVDFI